jgi:hypothetical protein
VQIAVTTPDGTHITIDNGWLSARSWFPMPTPGCGLNDGKSTWECSAFFGHDSVNILSPVDGVTGAAFAVAKALGPQRAQIE